MALRRLGATALRHAGASRAPTLASLRFARAAPATTTTTTTTAAAVQRQQAARHLHQQQRLGGPPRSYSTASTTALAAASAAAAVAKKVAAAAAVAAKTAASARKATTGGSAAAAMAKTLWQRAGGALFEGGALSSAAAAAGTAALSAAVVRSGGAGAGGTGATAAAATTGAAAASKHRREALLRHAAAVDRAFRLSRGRLPGTPFRIWRGLPFARVAARAAHGTALVALAIGHGCPPTLTTRLMVNLVAESCLRAVPLAGGPLAYLVFEKGTLGGAASNVALLERWAAREEACERKIDARSQKGNGARGLAAMLVPPWRRGVAPATARRRKGWTLLGTARRALMLAGAAGVLALLPAGVAVTAVATAVRWVLAAFFDSAGF